MHNKYKFFSFSKLAMQHTFDSLYNALPAHGNLTVYVFAAYSDNRKELGWSALSEIVVDWHMQLNFHIDLHTCTTDSSTQGALVFPHGHCVDNPSTKSEKQCLSVIKKDCSSEEAPSVYIPKLMIAAYTHCCICKLML